MSTEELVRAWKDPDGRGDGPVDHPSGGIELTESREIEPGGATTLPCVTVVSTTTAISCWPSCDQTIWDGTCNVASYGCCLDA